MHPFEASLYLKGLGCIKKPRNPLMEVKKNAKNIINRKLPRPNITDIKEIGKCHDSLGKSFQDVLSSLPESGLEKKQSPSEKKRKVREEKRKFKKTVEDYWENNDVDQHLAQRTSYSSRNTQRINHGFETYEDAERRVETTPPSRKAQPHIPASIEGDTENLLRDVENWPKQQINWSEMAKKIQEIRFLS